MPYIRDDGALRGAVAAQAVGDQAPRLVSKSSQQALEEALGGSGIPAALDQNVELDAILVDRAPEVMKRAVDADEDQTSPGCGRRRRSRLANSAPNFLHPGADTLVRHRYAPLRKDELDVAQASSGAAT